MRILFVPLHAGGLPHCGPLIALSRMCEGQSVETAFLLERKSHAAQHAAGINVLPIDHLNTMVSELAAYRLFRPDVVVDDCSLTTSYAASVWGVPRVPIVRTGTFEGYVPRNPRHRFSLRVNFQAQQMQFSEGMNLGRPQQAGLFCGSKYLVPGIPTIERLPDATRSSADHVYAGPLLLDDDCVERVSRATAGHVMARQALERFCDAQLDRKLAFFTFGNVHEPTEEIRESIRQLLARDVAVISTIRIDARTVAERERFHHAPYVPMHGVCGRANLMVHQCGSATYHYGLLHETAVITIGSRCFDRDDVAVRLEELGVSRHLDDPADEPNFVERFVELADAALADRDREARLARIRALKDEMARTRDAFRLVETLADVVERERRRPQRAVVTGHRG